MEFASKGLANAGLATGIIGTALGTLGSGLIGGNVLGVGGNAYVSKDVFDAQLQLIDANKQIAILNADLNTETKIVDAYKSSVERENKIREELKTEIAAVEKAVADNAAAQSVINATMSNQVNLNTSKIAQLFGLTQLIIPNASVQPGWGGVSIMPTGCTTVGTTTT